MTTSTTSWSSGQSAAPLPPQAPGLPLLGSGLKMMNDPLSYLVSCYGQFGPIFRLRALNRNLTVMAGLEANQFLARAGDEHFGSEALFGGFAREMGTRVFLVALDGEEHRRLRKLMRRGYFARCWPPVWTMSWRWCGRRPGAGGRVKPCPCWTCSSAWSPSSWVGPGRAQARGLLRGRAQLPERDHARQRAEDVAGVHAAHPRLPSRQGQRVALAAEVVAAHRASRPARRERSI